MTQDLAQQIDLLRLEQARASGGWRVDAEHQGGGTARPVRRAAWRSCIVAAATWPIPTDGWARRRASPLTSC
jgi:hypothetical protein